MIIFLVFGYGEENQLFTTLDCPYLVDGGKTNCLIAMMSAREKFDWLFITMQIIG